MTTIDFPPSLLPHLSVPERDELATILARRTPAGLAIRASRGRWTLAPHLRLLNERLLAAARGERPRLMICMPPRHGKSEFASKYFPAWFLGTFPDRRVILTSYEADFAATWGRKVRDVLEGHGDLFGVRVRKDSAAANRWDLEGYDGGMATAGVGGPITGRGAHLMIIDDPVKNAEEAASETYRNRAWDWYASTAYTRLEPGGIIVLIQTRWHEDDLAGRILAHDASRGEWDVLNLPAQAEPDDALGRPEGRALWPERYDDAALATIRVTLGSYWFAALYQQRPRPREGGFFKRAWFSLVDSGLADDQYPERVRWWDMAATEGGGDWTVGLLMSRTADGLYTIEDVVRGQWSPYSRDAEIRRTADRDRARYGFIDQWCEQEPGSSGVSAAQAFVRLLEGHAARAERTTGDKQVNAGPLASMAEAGMVRVLRAPWSESLLAELCDFPTGKHDDQVDAASRAFNKLAERYSGPIEVDTTLADWRG
jgi:predicted phage terminase large subunit-like protein